MKIVWLQWLVWLKCIICVSLYKFIVTFSYWIWVCKIWVSHLLCLDVSSRHLLCERILGFFEKRIVHLQERYVLHFEGSSRIKDWIHTRGRLIQALKGVQVLWSQSKMRRAHKTISDIFTNTILTGVKDGVFLCVSLLVFVTFFFYHN